MTSVIYIANLQVEEPAANGEDIERLMGVLEARVTKMVQSEFDKSDQRMQSEFQKLDKRMNGLHSKVGMVYEVAARCDIEKRYWALFARPFVAANLLGVVRLSIPKADVEQNAPNTDNFGLIVIGLLVLAAAYVMLRRPITKK